MRIIIKESQFKRLLEQKSFKFDLVYTSVLKRAIHTMELCLDSLNINKIHIKYKISKFPELGGGGVLDVIVPFTSPG